jgi:hypothetical protein
MPAEPLVPAVPLDDVDPLREDLSVPVAAAGLSVDMLGLALDEDVPEPIEPEAVLLGVDELELLLGEVALEPSSEVVPLVPERELGESDDDDEPLAEVPLASDGAL